MKEIIAPENGDFDNESAIRMYLELRRNGDAAAAACCADCILRKNRKLVATALNKLGFPQEKQAAYAPLGFSKMAELLDAFDSGLGCRLSTYLVNRLVYFFKGLERERCWEQKRCLSLQVMLSAGEKSPSPSEVLSHREEAELLHEAMWQALPPGYRALLHRLFALDGGAATSLAELAAEQGVTRSSVCQKKARALAELRRYLDSLGLTADDFRP